MSEKPILTSRRGAVGVVTLNRPGEYNTFNPEFAELLNSALKDFDKDPDTRVIVINAVGKNFSTGIELGEFNKENHTEYRKFIALMDEHNHTIARMEKPVIASVQGYCLANGAGLSFACDMTVASESAVFGTTAINVGLICLGPAAPLLFSLGRKKVLEMVLTGDMIKAPEALEMGIVNKVVPDDKLEEETFALAEKIAKKSPLAVKVGKKGIYAMGEMPYHQGLNHLSELFAALASTEDAQEGIKAFLEKRKPEFKGR